MRVSSRASASKKSASRSRMLSSAMRFPARWPPDSRWGVSIAAWTRSPRRSDRTSTAPPPRPPPPPPAHQHVADARARLDAMVDGVLEDRLQHHRRQKRIERRRIELPGDTQPVGEPQMLDLGIALKQRQLIGKPHELARIGHQRAE